MKNKIFILFLFVLIAFLPVKPLKYLSSNEHYDFLIANCNKDGKSLFYKVIQGEINLSDKNLPNNQTINKDTIILEYNSIPTRIRSNGFYIKSTQSNLLFDENSKKYIISYSITDWKPKKYTPWCFIWSYFEWSIFIILFYYLLLKK